MWMISGTGSDDDSAKVPIQLLKVSAFVCFGMSAILVSVLAILHLLRLLEATSFIGGEKAASFHPLVLCFFAELLRDVLDHRFWQPSSTGHQR
jgi:hypothetical protein